ncbi:MAG: hypothetical protein EU551_03635 [Promethearchaeota archaeon]|nr:MAG: hypothetical protein EU551_03635 [Candidatus Lokiarchaeota archaeon]
MSFARKIKRSLGKIFHKPTIQIDKSNILLYITLIIIFVIALLMRLMPIFYAEAEIHALDPFVQFRATNYILNNGIFEFFNWHDTQSWYPYGKNMGTSIFPGTPLSGLTIYYFLNFLGIPVTLLEACVMTPAIVGAITVVAMYFLGKVIANKKVGLLAAFFLMVSPGHMTRTYAGFYDNEGLGILSIVLTLLFFIHSLKKGSILSGIMGGVSLGVLSAAWGSWTYMYALISLGAFLLIIINKYSTRLLMSFSLTVGVGLIITIIVPRNNINTLEGPYGLISLAILGLLFFIGLWKRYKGSKFYFFKSIGEKINWKKLLLYVGSGVLILVIIFASVGILDDIMGLFMQSGFLSGFGGRVLAIINPLYVTQATRSVAEHIPSAWSVYYYNFSFMLLLLPVGIFFLFKRLREEDILMVLFGFTMVYFASSYVRLQLLLAPAVAIIGAFGLVYLFRPFSLLFKKKLSIGRRKRRLSNIGGRELGVAIVAFFAFILIYPTMHGIWNGWASLGKSPGVIDDMEEGYTWMRTSIPYGTVVMSWWDYGYRITTLGEKVSVDDNATSNSTQMGMVGRMFMSTNETTAVEICRKYNVSYVMVRWGFYQSGLAGDDGKWQWMLRIASQTLEDTEYAIDVASIWSEEEYKVTGEFFDTTLWQMLVSSEPYIDDEKTYTLASGGTVTGLEILQSSDSTVNFFKPFWARLTNPNDQDQYKTVEGNDWDYYNPDPMGPTTTLPFQGDYVTDVETFPSDGHENDMLSMFDVAFYSTYRVMKVYKVNYEKADLNLKVTDIELYNNSVAYMRVNNTGKRTFNIDEIKIGSEIASINNKISGNGTSDLKNIYPGESIYIRSSEFGDIDYNETYNVKVTIQDSEIESNTITTDDAVVAEQALNYGMTISEDDLFLFNNESIVFSVQNTGDDYIAMRRIELNFNITGETFYTNDSSNIIAPGETKRYLVDTTTISPEPDMSIDKIYENLTIYSDLPSNLNATFHNVTVISNTYCANVYNLTAMANETLKFHIRNNGFYDLIIDHVRLNGLIWDEYITPDPHKFSLNKNDNQQFIFETTPDVLNLNASDVITLNITAILPVNETVDEQDANLYGNYNVINDWDAYNITIEESDTFSNETLIINLTNTGKKLLTISDFKITTNNTDRIKETTNFSKIGDISKTLTPNESALFKIYSDLNLNYSDFVNITVNTYEGAWASLDPLAYTKKTGNISITWSEAYQYNNTVFFNVSNVGNNEITVKNVYFDAETAQNFYAVDENYEILSNDYKTISSGSSQAFKATIKSSQMPLIDQGGELLLNVTAWEGCSDEIQVSWAYSMNFTSIFAYLNDTIIVKVKNSGHAGAITLNNFTVNDIACNWTLISGSTTLNSNELATVEINTTGFIDLKFADLINVTAKANFSSTQQNILYTYEDLFVLDTNSNITILEGWPYTYAFDNSTGSDVNDTVYITVMNTGAYDINLSNITINNLLRDFIIVEEGILPWNETLAPYETIRLVNSTNLGINLNATERININVSTNSSVGSDLVWDDLQVIVCYTKFNVTLLHNNNESYVNNSDLDKLFLNITNYGNETLYIGSGDIMVNNTVNYMYHLGLQSGISEIILNPGDTILINITLINLGPFVGGKPDVGEMVRVDVSWTAEEIYLHVLN